MVVRHFHNNSGNYCIFQYIYRGSGASRAYKEAPRESQDTRAYPIPRPTGGGVATKGVGGLTLAYRLICNRCHARLEPCERRGIHSKESNDRLGKTKLQATGRILQV